MSWDQSRETGGLLFVGGFPSGGTDLTKTILNAHPEVNLAGELPLLHAISREGFLSEDTRLSAAEAQRFVSHMHELDVYDNLTRLTHPLEESTVLELTRQLFDGQSARVWGNKTPQNSERIPELRSIFRSARFLIVVRDPRDTALSWHSKWGKDPLWAAEKWRSRMAAVHAESEAANSVVKIVRFEDLLADPEPSLVSICGWLGIEFSKRMLRHEEFTESMDGKRNYGRSIQRENFDKWKLSPPDLIERIEEIAHPTMQLFGYEPEYAVSEVPLRASEHRKAVVSDAMALVTVGNRSRADNSIMRRLRDVAGYAKRLRRR